MFNDSLVNNNLYDIKMGMKLMDLKFFLIQMISVVAWIFLFLSFYRKDTNKILVFQIIATLLYCIHYYFLGAFSGLLMCAFEAIFDYAYYKTDKDKYLYIVSVPIRIFCGMLFFYSFIDVLPIIASLIDGYILTKSKKIIVVGAIISYTLWVIYNICVMSYSGALTDAILVISNLGILLFNYNVFNREDKSGIPLKR